MDYEKKYKEALKDMRAIYPNLKGDAKLAIEHAFPELTESEDERIREELIEFIKWSVDRHFMREDFHQAKRPSEWITYLEKQKELPFVKDIVLGYPGLYFYDGERMHFQGNPAMEEKQKKQKPIKIEVYEIGKGTTICGQNYKCKKDYNVGNCRYIKDAIYHCGRDGYLTDQNGVSWSCTPEWFNEYIQSNTEWAEEEKTRFVSGQFLQCKLSFKDFKESEYYWLEYVGDDMYVGRSDNILNQKFHITPRQLYTLFSQQLDEAQEPPKKEEQVSSEYETTMFEETSSDEQIIDALIHHLNEQDGFLTAINCVSTKTILSWLKKQKEQKPIKWTELTWKDIVELEGIINNVHYDFSAGIGQESFGKEVLERFRNKKEDAEVDACEQKNGIEPVDWSKTKINGKPVSAENNVVDIRLPEWSEEDERMRKGLINFLRSSFIKENITDETVAPWIAYLERQKLFATIPATEIAKNEPMEMPSGESLDALADVVQAKETNVGPDNNIPREEYLYHLLANGVITFSDYEFLLRTKGRKPADLSTMMIRKEPYIMPIPSPMIADKPESEWSEEDEKIRQSIIKDIEFERNYTSATTDKVIGKYNEQINWLKALPERFNLQPKVKWSEEDKEALDMCLDAIPKRWTTKSDILLTKWLKDNLRPSWKPSRKQIEALQGAITYMAIHNMNVDSLVSLHKDIKKL